MKTDPTTKTPLQGALSWARRNAKPTLRSIPWMLGFLLVWAALNVFTNIRYPLPSGSWSRYILLPAIDVTVMLGVLVLLAALRRPPPRWLLVGFVVVLWWSHIFHVSEVLVYRTYYRPINLTLDVPLLPELARLAHSTVPWHTLLLGTVGGLIAVAAIGYALFRALRFVYDYASRGIPHQYLFFLVIAVFVGHSQRPEARFLGPWYLGLFGNSIVPVMGQQLEMARDAGELKRRKKAEIAAHQKALERLPSDLGRLGGADVLLFVVESYGMTAFTNPIYVEPMGAAMKTFETTLGEKGFHTASGALTSPTYGGGSWLAHATLTTGIETTDALDYTVLLQTRPRPRTVASFFKDAGYRTVIVQPGTTRPFPEGEVHGFEKKYYAFHFDYRGPAFSWAPMPDQYVVDYIHRQEIAKSDRPPLFIHYALVSSHSPWNIQPPLVEDWTQLGDGSLYWGLDPVKFAAGWSTSLESRHAYLRSLVYDFEVLAAYLPRFIERDTLVVVLGDHQPIGHMTDGDPSFATPVHVISRDAKLIELFTAKGYQPGMIPSPDNAPLAMHDLLSDWLQRFSGKSAAEPATGAPPTAPSGPPTPTTKTGSLPAGKKPATTHAASVTGGG